MRNMFEETFYGYDNNSEFFNKKYLRTLLKDHLDNKKDNRKLLWTLFIYIKWSEKNL